MDRIRHLCAAVALATLLLAPATVFGQQGRGGPPPTPRAAATVDLTGVWVAVVTEDWLYRMVTPAKGDRRNVPLNAAGIAATNAWDPAKDEADGAQCKAYGAVGAIPNEAQLQAANGLDLDAVGVNGRYGPPPATRAAAAAAAAVEALEVAPREIRGVRAEVGGVHGIEAGIGGAPVEGHDHIGRR